MANFDLTSPSYYALESLGDTACALSELAEVIPSDDRYSALLRILAERLDADMQQMQKAVYGLWQFVPDATESADEQDGPVTIHGDQQPEASELASDAA